MNDGLITIRHGGDEEDLALARKLREALCHCARELDGVRIESMGLTADVFPPNFATFQWEGDHDGKRVSVNDPLEALLWGFLALNKKMDEEGDLSRVRESPK